MILENCLSFEGTKPDFPWIPFYRVMDCVCLESGSPFFSAILRLGDVQGGMLGFCFVLENIEQNYPEGSRYVLRKGFPQKNPIPFWGWGIETINPDSREGSRPN